MLKVFSLCLGGEQPATLKSPAAPPPVEPVPVDGRRGSIGSVERQWQALYDGLHTVRGAWHERLEQVMGLAAACCGTAFVSAHLFCPYQSCFVVMSSGGPQAELLQPGDLHPADTCAGPASLHTGRLHTAGFFGAGGGSASALEPTSLQLLLKGKVTVHRAVTPPMAPPPAAPRPAVGGSGGFAAAADTSRLPPDWRRMHNNTQLTEFAAVPILDSGGSVVAAISVAGPASAAMAAATTDVNNSGSGGGGRDAGSPPLSAQVLQLERFARVLGLAFFSDPKQLPVYLLAASALTGVQRAETLQAMVESAHEGFGALLERHFRLEGARCVLALADSMEARVAYFGPPVGTAATAAGPAVAASVVSGTAPGNPGSSAALPVAGASSLSRGQGSCSSQQGPVASGALPGAPGAQLQGVLGPLMDTLLLEVVSHEGPGNGRVLTNCRAYLQQEDKPGRDVQVCFQLCRMPPACLVLAVAGAADSTLAPEVALYVCTAQQQLPGGLLEEVRAEMQCVLQLLMPHIHRQLLGTLSSEWAGMRLQAAAAGASSVLSVGGGGTGGAAGQSGGGDGGGSASVNSVLGGLSGGLSLGGLCRTVSFTVDDMVSHSPAHLKVVVAGIQSTITTVQMNQAWQAAGDTGTRESIDDLYSIRLRETVGQGGQGVVFRGLMHGLEVAVKVVAKDMPGALIAKVQQQQQQAAAAAGRRGGGGNAAGGGGGSAAPRPVDPEQVLRTAKRELIRDALELAVTSAVNHPHIVQVHNYFFDVLVVGYAQDEGSAHSRLPEGAGGGAANGTPPSTLSNSTTSNHLRLVRRVDATEEMVAEGPTNLVIVMEYCDAGTLKDVLRRGYFKRGVDANGWPRLDLTSMYICLLEVALALRHMHSLALVHCDLKPSNVLLRSHPRDPRGWTCKLSDFGCVRMLKPPAEDGTGPTFPHFTVTRALGTLTHMAPEVISKGALLTSSVDVYSFGIMMAELVTGVPQDQCMPGKEAIQLARKGVRPTLPPYCPKEYRDVATACWSPDPHARPTTAELVNVLQMLLNQIQGGNPSSNSMSHMLPQVLQQQLAAAAHGRFPGAAAVAQRAAAAVPAPAPGPAAVPHGGRALAAAAALAAAMQQASAGAAAAASNAGTSSAAAAATAAGFVGTNIVVTPLQQLPRLPSPGAAAGSSSGMGSTSAAAAAARAFPGASPSQILATAAERVLVKGGTPAAVAAPIAGGDSAPAAAAVIAAAPSGGDAAGSGARLSPQCALASTLSASLQHHFMLQQVQQQMHLHHQQQQQAQQQQAQQQQAQQQQAQQQQAQQQQAQQQQQQQAHVHQQILRQALQQHALLQQEQMAQLQAAQQQQAQLQHIQAQLLQQQQQILPLQEQLLEPPTPQQQHPMPQLELQQPVAVAVQRPIHIPAPAQAQARQHEQVQARQAQAVDPKNVLITSSGTSGMGAASGNQKPGSFTSAASAFSAAGALSPTASSLSSSARQLPSQPQAASSSQQLPGGRDAAGSAAAVAGGGDGSAAAAAATGAPVPIAIPGSPVAIANTTSGQNSSPVRTEYDSPAEHNLSGTCSDVAAGAQRTLLAGDTTAAASGGAAAAAAGMSLYAFLETDLLFNTAGSNAAREGSCGPEAALVAGAAALTAGERGSTGGS